MGYQPLSLERYPLLVVVAVTTWNVGKRNPNVGSRATQKEAVKSNTTPTMSHAQYNVLSSADICRISLPWLTAVGNSFLFSFRRSGPLWHDFLNSR